MSRSVTIERRTEVPTWLAYGAPVFTILAALLVATIPLLWLNINPVSVYWELFISQPTSLTGLGDVLMTALPLFFAGLAVYIPLKAGLWNIGAEGQLFVGAVFGSVIALHVDLPAVLLLPLMIGVAGVAGAVYGAIPGYLRAEHDVNEIISSLMLTFTAVTFTGYLLRGPLQGSSGQSATDRFPDAAQLPSVLVPRLHVGIFLIVVAAVVAALILNRTRLGYEITFIGANPTAAVQSGISKYKVYVIVFVLGGFLAGIAGIVEVSGVHGRFFEEFSPGYGFTAVAVALLGRNGVGRVLAAALFFGILTAGGTTIAVTQNVPSALIDVIVALTILFLLTAEFVKEHRIEFGRVDADAGVTPEGSS